MNINGKLTLKCAIEGPKDPKAFSIIFYDSAVNRTSDLKIKNKKIVYLFKKSMLFKFELILFSIFIQ